MTKKERPATPLLAAALAAALLLPGCLGGELVVVASAPIQANGLTVAAARSGGLLADATLDYELRYMGERVFPAEGVWRHLSLQEGKGTAFVPYGDFVTGNGDYSVVVRDGDATETARFTVSKWVSYVYVKPYMRDNTLVIDAILESASGGFPQDRIVAAGELDLEIRYRGPDGGLNQTAHTLVDVPTSPYLTFTRVTLPVKDMRHYKGPGYYSVDAVFDNHQARGNAWVRNDPVLSQRSPPGNWVYVDV